MNAADSRMISRLTREMMKVIQADLTNGRGMRNVIDGEAEFLEGFDFNINGKLGTTLYAPFTTQIDRVSGQTIVELEPFIPANMINAPSGTTHFKIVSCGGDIDFEEEVYRMETVESPIRAWDNVATPTITLEGSAAANTHTRCLLC